jgi:hypothetical protein
MIDKHMFPENYFFAVTKEGIDGRRSLLIESGHRRRRSSLANSQAKAQGHTQGQAQSRDDSHKGAATLTIGNQTSGSTKKPPGSSDEIKEADEPSQDKEMSDLTGAMSALQFVPPSVRFGRGRAGFSKS